MSDPLGPTIAAAAPRFAPGAVVADRFEVLGLLGEGGMGAVFRARDRELDDEIALKLLRDELATRPDALTRFRREVKLARRVTHPNVARTYDLGTAGDVHYLTMELIAGRSLASALGAGRLPLGEALRVAAEVASGLVAAHVAGVVHRDLKPENVMLSGERVVLTDFGIASLAEGLDPGSLRTDAIVGTPAYMAPEQLEGRPLDGRTDVYALGLVLFELLVGHLPWGSASPLAIVAEKLRGSVPDVRVVDPTLPDALCALVTAALEPRREARPDAAQLKERLDALRGGPLRGGLLSPSPRLGLRDSIATPRAARRTLLFAGVEAPPELAALGADVAAATRDELAKVRGLTITDRGADLRLEVSLRAARDRARVRLRLFEPGASAPLWSDVVEGTLEDAFALEDAVSRCAAAAARERLGSRGEEGPSDPAVREAYERARRAYEGFAPEHTLEALAILEPLAAESDDGHVLALLAAALLNRWAHEGALEPGLIARAEDLALRALDHEPPPPLAFLAIARLREQAGELRATARAVRETLERAPHLAPAHGMLGALLCEAGRVEEGLRHIERASQLTPGSVQYEVSKANALVPFGDSPAVRASFARARELGGPTAAVYAELRACTIWADRELSADLADRIEAGTGAATYKMAVPFLRSVATGSEVPLDLLRSATQFLTGPTVALMRRVTMLRSMADMFAYAGADGDVIDALDRLRELPLIDLAWLDHAASLARFRGEPAFARTRAAAAARVAELFE